MIAAGMCFNPRSITKSERNLWLTSLAVTLNVNSVLSYSSASVLILTDFSPKWAQKPPCGSFLQLRRKKEPTSTSISTTAPATSTAKPTKYADSIIVRVMDSCAGCKAGTAHVDLTKAAFKSLYALDIGCAAVQCLTSHE